MRKDYALGSLLLTAGVLCVGCGSQAPVPTPTTPSTVAAKTVRISVPDGRTATLVPGFSLPLAATLVASDGSTEDITPRAIWQSSNPVAAIVSPAGVVSGFTESVVRISATYEGASASLPLLVRYGCDASTSLIAKVDSKTQAKTYVTGETVSAFSVFSDVLLFVGSSDCRWTRSKDVNWIFAEPADRGVSGNGGIGFSPDANNSTQERTGHILIHFPSGPDLVYTVTQRKPDCSLMVDPPSVSSPVTGVSGEFQLTVTPPSCSWRLVEEYSKGFLKLTGPTAGTGSAKIPYKLLAGSTASKMNDIIIYDANATSPPNFFVVTLQ